MGGVISYWILIVWWPNQGVVMELTLFLRGENLTDEEARVHSFFLKGHCSQIRA
jgi:hypothetical protein